VPPPNTVRLLSKNETLHHSHNVQKQTPLARERKLAADFLPLYSTHSRFISHWGGCSGAMDFFYYFLSGSFSTLEYNIVVMFSSVTKMKHLKATHYILMTVMIRDVPVLPSKSKSIASQNRYGDWDFAPKNR
jgi:hypothetical protein